jgi:hypothetical protein
VQLKVALSTGSTLTFDLPAGLGAWSQQQADPAFQRNIRSLAILYEGASHVLPAPVAFRRVLYMAEVRLNENGAPASSRVGYAADGVLCWMTVYAKRLPPMVRFDVRQTGRMVWRHDH